MEQLIAWIPQQNIELAILICLILLVRVAFKKVLAPKAIYLLWLIVLVKSFAYLNIPYVYSKQVQEKPEIINFSNKANSSIEKNDIHDIRPKALIENEKTVDENFKVVESQKEKVVKKKTTSGLFASIMNYFTFTMIKKILIWSYLFIFAGLLIHLLMSLVSVRRLKIGSTQNDLLTNKLQTLKTNLKIKNKVQIFESNRIPSPTLIGVFSPTILIPTNILGNISNANLEDIITHELMHIKRKDTLVNLIFRVATCLYFYNPFVWLAYFTMKKDMESACDQDVLSKSDFKNNISYAESLLLITKLCKQNGQVNHHAMMFIHKNIFKRIDMITNLKKTGVLSRVVFTAAIIVALIAFVPSYKITSEETNTNIVMDKIVLSLDNSKNENTQVFLNNQLKDALKVKNIFIYTGYTRPFNMNNFKFNGTYKEFKDLILEDFKTYIYFYNDNLYITKMDEKLFQSQFSRMNSGDSKIKDKLEFKIKSITFENTDLIEAIQKISKETGVEIDLTGYSEYPAINSIKNSYIFKNTIVDISVRELLISLTYQLNESCVIDILDNKIILSGDVEWKKRYNTILKKQIALKSKKMKLRDFIQTIRGEFPDLTIILQHEALKDVDLTEQSEVSIDSNESSLESLLKSTLNHVKLDYELTNNALFLTSTDNIEKYKVMNEMSKKLYLSKLVVDESKQKDINQLLELPVSFDFTNTKLKDGLEILSNLSNIGIIYKDGVINENNNTPIQMVANGLSVKNALSWMLANFDVEYRIYKNNIVIQKKSFIEIPASTIEFKKAIPNLEESVKNKYENLFIIKPNKEFKIELNGIEKIQVNNKSLDRIDKLQIISVDNNFILVNTKDGNIPPGTSCTIFYKDSF